MDESNHHDTQLADAWGMPLPDCCTGAGSTAPRTHPSTSRALSTASTGRLSTATGDCCTGAGRRCGS